MKVLGVIGSPRRDGNTSILIDEVLRGARDVGAIVQKIFLNDLDIKPCQSTCSANCKKTGNCTIDDDMSPLYDELYDSNVIILGTPVYWYGPSAQLKTFIDRWFAFSHPEFINRMTGKKMILVAPFEETDISASDALVEMISRSAKYLKMELLRTLLVTAGEKGAVRNNKVAMTQAYRMGLDLK
jgi:multimeric flavodoxin WrbA